MQALELFLNSVNTSVWYSLAGLLYLGLTIAAAVHALLHKERESTAVAWLGLIILSPGIGLVLYWLLGINRIKRRALREFAANEPKLVPADTKLEFEEPANRQWQTLMHTGLSIHRDQYIPGNHITPLINGDQSYPAMINAIAVARDSIVLSSYIFDYDKIGKRFVEALGEAHRRGVTIRVMIDGIGVGYSFSWIKTDLALRKLGIPTARFLPTLSRKGTRFINLRNHRKILSIDGQVAFLGGINIRDSNLTGQSDHATQDVHFRLKGPAIDQINALFIEDWQFACYERLNLPLWSGEFPGNSICRVLPDGPDENYLKLQLTLTNAINSAKKNIRIITPYFLPGNILTQALGVAALRGVKVDVVVPKKSNIRLVDWALQANLPTLLSSGIHMHFGPEPFDHSKLFLIDGGWCMIGSSNWDARSLELNFEVNLECFDNGLNQILTKLFCEKLAACESASEAHYLNPPLLHQLRNSLSRLFSPYL